MEVWSEKKTKLLNQLGLDMKSGGLDYVDPLASENAKKKEEAKKDEPQTNNRLVEFRKMRGGQS